MTDFTPETDFFAAHEAYSRRMDEFQVGMQSINEGFKAEREAIYKEKYPRRKFDLEKAMVEPWFDGVYEKWKTKADALNAERDAFKKMAEEYLKAAAEVTEVPTSDEMIEISRVSGGMWHTQGYGANRYAMGSALSDADKAEYHGLRTEVRTIEKEKADRWGISYETYGVYANTTQAGLALLDYKESPPLREQVRLSWKRGTNPRVNMPFLPHGYEEQEGIDYFGNDLRAVENPSPMP